MPISKLIYFLCFILSSPFFANGQQIGKKIKEIKSAEVTHATVDRLGNFFIVSKKNVIKKFDSQGKLMATLKGNSTTLLEPWYHPSIFLFSHLTQKYWIYGRYFENEKEYSIEPSWAIQPTLVCPSNDNKLWLFDVADASIKKVNPATKEVVIEFYTDTIQAKGTPVYTHLREYQNMIFLLNQQSGIEVYSHIGKKIYQVDKAGINNFNFFGEELYYLDGTKMKFFDLGTGTTREIEVGGDYKYVLASDESIILVSQKNRILVFENKPSE
ncbi:MAG: hypothetical protein ORN54_04080 [Cyclobacteriaceae bacterium]|nr:hypothetical protein [Cyclobacteriaceae bacterium]